MTPAPYDPSARQAVFDDFWAFHLAHPELRFWQAVSAWSGQAFILAGDGKTLPADENPYGEMRDTFYWETKDGKPSADL